MRARTGLSGISRVVILAAFYLIGGLAGHEASFLGGQVPLVWPTFGIALGAVLLFGPAYWPAVAGGAALFAFASGYSPGWVMLGAILGNTFGALVCWRLLRSIRFSPSLDTVRGVAAFLAAGCVIGATVNGAFMSASLALAGDIDWDQLFEGVVHWWVPNAMGVILAAPLILVWGSAPPALWTRSRIGEGLLCAGGLAVAASVSFHSWYVYGVQNYPWAYLPYPFLIWAALRFGQRGAVSGSLIIAILSINALLDGRGPFVAAEELDSLMLIGSYVGVIGVTTMLLAAVAAERLAAERLMRESEQRYRSVVEDQTEMIWRFDEEGNLTFVNDAYSRFHEAPKEALIGKKYLSMLSDEDRDIPLSYFRALTPENPVVTYDYKLSLPNDSSVWQQCTTRKLFDEAGAFLEFQSVAQDITQRKETEEDARKGEQRLRAILNSMVDGVVVIDRTQKINSINPAALALFGRETKDALQTPFLALFTEQDHASLAKYLHQNLWQSRRKTIEASALQPNGQSIPTELAVTETHISGVRYLIVVARDLRERKQLEEQFRQSQKMEVLGRLAGGVAHDFNNLIQAIIGYSNLLLNKLKDGPPPRETIEQIEKSAERAGALTSQLLAFSRKQALQPKVLSLNTIVTDMKKLLQRLIGENIVFTERIHQHLGAVRADQGQIEQVILNLSLNARDAMPDGGQLTIETENIELIEPLDGFSADFQPGHYVVLKVNDSGCGIPHEIRARLFEPFFTTKEPGKGTGLGLSIVFGIVRQSAGELAVVSEPGQGSSFHIYLPRVEAESDASSATDLEPAPGGAETILLVEDGEIVRAMFVEILQAHGYTILEAMDGEEALQLAAAYPDNIDLLVSDLVMPKIGGRELANRLLEDRPEMRVLFISGYSDEEVERFAGLKTRADFLQKPFRPEVLLRQVRRMMDSPNESPDSSRASLQDPSSSINQR